MCFLLVVMSATHSKLAIFRQRVQAVREKVEFIEDNLNDIRKVLISKDNPDLDSVDQEVKKKTSHRCDAYDHYGDHCKTFKQAVETLKEGTKSYKERVNSLTAELEEKKILIYKTDTL